MHDVKEKQAAGVRKKAHSICRKQPNFYNCTGRIPLNYFTKKKNQLTKQLVTCDFSDKQKRTEILLHHQEHWHSREIFILSYINKNA